MHEIYQQCFCKLYLTVPFVETTSPPPPTTPQCPDLSWCQGMCFVDYSDPTNGCPTCICGDPICVWQRIVLQFIQLHSFALQVLLSSDRRRIMFRTHRRQMAGVRNWSRRGWLVMHMHTGKRAKLSSNCDLSDDWIQCTDFTSNQSDKIRASIEQHLNRTNFRK